MGSPTTDHRPPGHTRALVALLAGAAAIGFAPIFVRMSELPGTASALYRVALAIPVFWSWSSREPGVRRRPDRRARRVLALTGVVFALDLFVWHLAIHRTSVANATFLPNLAPIFVTVGAWIFFQEAVSRGFLIGLGVSISGAALLVGGGFSLSSEQLVGDLLAVLTAVFYAGYMLCLKELRRTVGSGTIMLWVAVGSTLWLLPATLAIGEPLLPVTLGGWAVLFGLSWLVHAGGQGMIAVAFAHLPASFSAVTLLVQPLASALLAWWLFGEALGTGQAIGGLAIVSGVVIAQRASSLSRTPSGAHGAARAASMRST